MTSRGAVVVLATELPFAVVGEDVYVSELASNKLMQKMDGNSFNGAWVSNAARRRKKFTEPACKQWRGY